MKNKAREEVPLKNPNLVLYGHQYNDNIYEIETITISRCYS